MEPNLDGSITGRITDKFINHTFEREIPILELSNGTTYCGGMKHQHYCHVSKEKYDKHSIGEVYICEYKMNKPIDTKNSRSPLLKGTE
jgi:hypothetical protein